MWFVLTHRVLYWKMYCWQQQFISCYQLQMRPRSILVWYRDKQRQAWHLFQLQTRQKDLFHFLTFFLFIFFFPIAILHLLSIPPLHCLVTGMRHMLFMKTRHPVLPERGTISLCSVCLQMCTCVSWHSQACSIQWNHARMWAAKSGVLLFPGGSPLCLLPHHRFLFSHFLHFVFFDSPSCLISLLSCSLFLPPPVCPSPLPSLPDG